MEETIKATELIGSVISNEGRHINRKITGVAPVDNVGHFRTDYNYIVFLDGGDVKWTVEELNVPTLPSSVEFE